MGVKPSFQTLPNIHAQVLQQVCQRVDWAFIGFFRRLKERAKTGEKAGFPRYKGQNRYDSITYPQFSNGCRLDDKGLRLGKIGCIRIVQHRPLEGMPKSCTLRRTATGKWFASISCNIGDACLSRWDGRQAPEKTDAGSAVGIDVGLDNFAMFSDKENIANPRFFRQEEKALAKAQRKWDKVRKVSPKKRERARKTVARVHERIRNRRHNFVHQEARKVVNKYGFVATEKLDAKKMQKNRRLSKSISDAAWSLFRHCLEYKAEEAGIGFKAVNPKYTSQDCSACGHREKKALSDRVHHCKACGYTADRDLNAAINILTLGLQSQAT